MPSVKTFGSPKKTDSLLHGSSGSTSRPAVITPPPVRFQERACAASALPNIFAVIVRFTKAGTNASILLHSLRALDLRELAAIGALKRSSIRETGRIPYCRLLFHNRIVEGLPVNRPKRT